MGALSFDALFRTLKKGALDPVYYLYGDEDVLKQEAIRSLLEHGLDAATRDFNLDQRDAASLDPEAFHALVQTPPMLALRRVVVLRAVEQLRKKTKIRDALLRYLDSPNPDTVLVLVQGANQETEADLARRTTAVDIGPLPPERVRRWIDHRANWQIKSLSELKVPLIMRRNRHDRSSAVAHQHVIGDPEWNQNAIHRIHGVGTSENARFLFGEFRTVQFTLSRGFIPILADVRLLVGRCEAIDEGVLRRDDHIRRPIQRIRARRINT